MANTLIPKPLLLPLVNDITKFKNGVLELIAECEEKFLNKNDDEKAYKLLVHCTLAMLIIFNRRRIGDVQYLKIKDYESEKRSKYTDFENVLTSTEKQLTKKYKRIVNSGKGSRAVVILVPESLQKLIALLLKNRKNTLNPIMSMFSPLLEVLYHGGKAITL